MPPTGANAPVNYWLREPSPPADPPLSAGERLDVDVAIIGAGFTGLWTAIALTDTDPSLRVVVLEAETVAFGASGRNGGFCEASLTHGLANGIRHFPDELPRLEQEGIENLAALIAFTREHGIDCDLEETGTLGLADQPYQVDEFRAWVDEAAEHGEHLVFLDRDAARAEVHSPLWHAGLYRPPGPRRAPGPREAVPRPGPRRTRAWGRRARAHPRDRASSDGPAASRSRRRPAPRSGRTRSSSRRRPTRAGCAASRRCSCRSTTTSSCPIR